MSNLSSKYRYIAKNSIALFIGNFASKLLVFFLLPLYTSILTTAEYAIADLINTTSGLLMIVLSLAISDAILRFAMDESNDKSQILTIGFLIFAIGGILAIAIGIGIYYLPAFATYSEFALISVLLYISSSLERILSSFVKGLENIKLISIVGVISTCVVIFSNIIMLVFLKWGITGYLLSYVLAHFVACLLYFFWGKVYRYFRIQRVDKFCLVQMLRYCTPLIFTQICWQLDASAAKYIVAFFADETAVGLLSAAHKIPAILTLVTTLFMQAWNLSAIKENGTEDSTEFYGSVFDIYMSVILLGAGALILFSQLLGAILLQGDFYIAWRYIPFYIFAFVFNSISGFLGSFYLAKKQTKSLMGAVVLGTTINIVLGIILFKLIGLIGMGIAASIGYAAIALLRLWKCHREKIFSYSKIKVYTSLIILCFLCVCMTLGKGIFMYSIAGLLFAILIGINISSILVFSKKLFKSVLKRR